MSAYLTLTDLSLMNLLEVYNPVLVGTVPLDIDVPGSDLDIICEAHDFFDFEKLINKKFSALAEYRLKVKNVNNVQRIVVNFIYKDWPIEIFGQPIPTVQQNGYRHMIIEHKIINNLGDGFKERIRALKQVGIKTEPAFGQLLKLEGNCYEQLLEIASWNEERLERYLSKLQLL